MVREAVQPYETNAVGVRELRQNLSVYLARVKRGEALTVCEHGTPIAILRPLPAADSVAARLIAEGRATAAARTARDLRRPRRATPGAPLPSRILDELRDERLP